LRGDVVALVRSPQTGAQYLAAPADWGPHIDTDRIADISPGLMDALGISTDDEVEVVFPYEEELPMDIAHVTELRSRIDVLKELNNRVQEAHADDDDDAFNEASGLLEDALDNMTKFIDDAAEAKALDPPPKPEEPPAA
jgi:hypothetical protein